MWSKDNSQYIQRAWLDDPVVQHSAPSQRVSSFLANSEPRSACESDGVKCHAASLSVTNSRQHGVMILKSLRLRELADQFINNCQIFPLCVKLFTRVTNEMRDKTDGLRNRDWGELKRRTRSPKDKEIYHLLLIVYFTLPHWEHWQLCKYSNTPVSFLIGYSNYNYYCWDFTILYYCTMSQIHHCTLLHVTIT